MCGWFICKWFKMFARDKCCGKWYSHIIWADCFCLVLGSGASIDCICIINVRMIYCYTYSQSTKFLIYISKALFISSFSELLIQLSTKFIRIAFYVQHVHHLFSFLVCFKFKWVSSFHSINCIPNHFLIRLFISIRHIYILIFAQYE